MQRSQMQSDSPLLSFVSRVNVILGDLGMGKSAFAFYLAEQIARSNRLPIIANIPNSLSLRVMDNPLQWEHSAVLILDEAHLILDSRAFATKLSREISQQLSFLRKRNQILIATFQYWGQVDIRLRAFTRGVWIAQGNWHYEYFVPHYSPLEESPEPSWESLAVFHIPEVQQIFGKYDTLAIPSSLSRRS